MLEDDLLIFDDLRNRINHIYLDVKYGSPKVKAMHDFVKTMEELNAMAGNRS